MRGEIRMKEQLLQWREEELADRLGQWKLPAFRVRQIYRQSRNYVELADMTDLPKQLREELEFTENMCRPTAQSSTFWSWRTAI